MSAVSSHVMKTTRRGRPFVKDTHDLFATLIVSLNLEAHRSFFKSFPNSFTTDEACTNLASLKFSQSNRTPDAKDPTRIVTTTTTTTFSMTRDMAKGICQYFMDSHLIENAADLDATTFKDRGIYMLTAKGLHILERFITKNGIGADHLLKVFATQPICMKLLHLERRSQDDEILITKSVVDVIFRRFVGTEPDVSRLSDEDLAAQYHSRFYNKAPTVAPGNELDRNLGLILRRPSKDKNGDEYQFSAMAAVDWLIDYTTMVGMDEAAELLAQFVRYGLISLVVDKGRVKEENLVVTVKAGVPGGGAGALMQEAEFRATDKAIYRITKEGIQTARWDRRPNVLASHSSAAASKADLRPEPSISSVNSSGKPRSSQSEDIPAAGKNLTGSMAAATDQSMMRRNSITDRLRADYMQGGVGAGSVTSADKESHVKDSHTARLRQILEEPALRSLFREFLRANFCEENLSFWLDVQDFKRRFNTTSSAIATPGTAKTSKATSGHQAMEKHQQDLITMAFIIYNSYLAPASPCELNIDHNLRGELITYMNQVMSDKDAGLKGTLEPGIGNTLHASQLQTMVKLYERIQGYIFRLMATDSVPKFVKTERFLNLMRTMFDYNERIGEQDAAPGATETLTSKGQSEREPSPTRAFVTISQASRDAANEKEAAKHKQSMS
ncbi:GTPase-activating protein SST2, partial [Tremellales sp. Uapishka_1]